MASEVSSQLKIINTTVERNTGKGVNAHPAVLSHSRTYDSGAQATGTGSNQQDLAWSDAQTVAAGTPDDWDLAGTLTSELSGATITFVEITKIIIINLSETTGENLQIGGDANSLPLFGAAADYIVIGPGGVFVATNPIDGWTVTGGTGDILQVASASGTISYEITIEGRSA